MENSEKKIIKHIYENNLQILRIIQLKLNVTSRELYIPDISEMNSVELMIAVVNQQEEIRKLLILEKQPFDIDKMRIEQTQMGKHQGR